MKFFLLLEYESYCSLTILHQITPPSLQYSADSITWLCGPHSIRPHSRLHLQELGGGSCEGQETISRLQLGPGEGYLCEGAHGGLVKEVFERRIRPHPLVAANQGAGASFALEFVSISSSSRLCHGGMHESFTVMVAVPSYTQAPCMRNLQRKDAG